jgi:hypothetical protein
LLESAEEVDVTRSNEGTEQGPVPLDTDHRTVADIRNAANGEPLFPSIFGRFDDGATHTSSLVHTRSIDRASGRNVIEALNDLPYVQVYFKPCSYDNTNKAPRYLENKELTDFTNSFNAENDDGADLRAAFLDAIPDELGLEFLTAIESVTIDSLMSVNPPADSPTTIDIVSLSIGSVALAFGLGVAIAMFFKASGGYIKINGAAGSYL